MKHNTLRILLTGGGSGGHVYPLLAVVDALREAAKKQNVLLDIKYIGPKDAYRELFRSRGVSIGSIPAGKIRRYLSPLTLIDIPKFFIGLLAALFKVYFFMPDVIFSKGGTGALAVVIAGWFYRIPIIIHESDASPGLNNIFSVPFASRIAVSFEAALKRFNDKKAAWVGTPIRAELLKERLSQKDAKEALGFGNNAPLVLVLGGSLGSDRINKFILGALKELVSETQILHQTGTANFKEAETLSRAALVDVPATVLAKNRYHAVPYFTDDMKLALAAADLVVSRAGSGTIFEVASFGKPAILIPLGESANDHQRENAYEFSKAGAAVVIEEPNLLPAIFLSQVRAVLKDKKKFDEMSSASQKFFKPGAAEVIAEEILRIA